MIQVLDQQRYITKPKSMNGHITTQKKTTTKAVQFAKQKALYLIEHRSELSSEEKAITWYSSKECQEMAKKAGLRVLRESMIPAHSTSSHQVESQSTDSPLSPSSCSNSRWITREETRGLEQFLSTDNYKSFKNARKERIKAVLEAQRILRSFGVKDHSWGIHIASTRESLTCTMRASLLGLQDQAMAFEIYREG